MPEERFSLRLYRGLLKLYPAGFREHYADALAQEFRDELAASSGPAAMAGLWARLLADLAISLAVQFWRELRQDSRQAVRLWARNPWNTGFAILALAIGIGANTGVFSVVDALLLRSLPFHEPERLAFLQWLYIPSDSAKQFHEWRRESNYLDDAAVFETREANLGSVGEWRRAQVAQVSSNFFQLMGTQPILGRGFSAGDDVDAPGWGTPGPNAAAVISYGLWLDIFGGEARALGATIRVDGHALTVIGVAPRGFDYPGKAMLWKPGAFNPGNKGWQAVGRLKPGLTWPRARQAFYSDEGRFWPGTTIEQRKKYPPTIAALRDELAGPARQGSLILMACVALILLIACTNVANLLLARTADRAAEFSIRSALGASRARIVQQLLTECVLLSVAASVLGLGVAWLATEVAARFQPVATVSQAYSLLEGRVLAFAILLSMVSAVLFGLLPSFYAGRVHAFGTRSSNETRSRRLIREVLVAAQVMLTIVLVAASMSAGQAFVKLVSFDRGYETRGLATASVSLDGTIYDSNAQRFAYFQQVLDRLRRLPGVVSASATGFLPLDAKGFIGGRPSLDGRQAHQNSMVVPIFADYFRTMGGRILAGREFTEAEVHSGARVAMVNEAFANEFGSPRDVLDHEIGIGRNARWKVLGVVRGMDYMVDGANAYEMFIPSNSGGSTFVARVSGRAADRLAMIRDSIRSVDRQVPLFGVRTMEDRLDEALARPEFYRTSVLCFAVFALLLAVVGIYGIVSYAVARRTHEMGVRMALGVTSGQLRMSVLRQGVTTVLVGSAMGVAGSIMGGRVLENLMVGAKPVEAAGYTAAVGLIVSIAAAGIWMATRPITRLDIVEILRRE